jgi:hypothetical protein
MPNLLQILQKVYSENTRNDRSCGYEVPGMVLLRVYLYTYSYWEESPSKYSPLTARSRIRGMEWVFQFSN